MFITFEGGEGAGKTTLIQRLYEELKRQGKKVLTTRAPGGTKIGTQVREMLLHKEHMSGRCELLLFMADRAQHVDEVILPALQSGHIVLCDRFNDSTLAYQAGARGFPSDYVSQLCLFATNQLQPDLTLYLDLDPEKGLARVKRSKDRIEQEALSFHQKIRATYLEIAKKEPNRFHVLDASKSPDAVFTEALALLPLNRECSR